MTELRDYILSKLQEQLGKAERNPAGVKAVATWKRNRRLGKPGSTVRIGQSDTGEEAALHMEKKAGELKGKLKSRAFGGVGQTSGGMRAWSNIQQGYSADARQDASTDLRTQLMYILANKLDEVIIDRRNEKMINPFKEPEPKINDPKFDVSEYLPKPKPKPGAGRKSDILGTSGRPNSTKREDSSTNLKARMVDILLMEFTGTSRDYVARALSREGKGNSMKHRSRLGKALASVINAQPQVEKARAERDAANAAQDAANTARRGSNGRSSDSATHWRNNWPSDSWGSA